MTMAARFVAALLMAALSARAPEPLHAVRFAVIVSKQNATTNITKADLRRIYVGAITRWPDGTRIAPVVFHPDTAEGHVFLEHVVEMTDIDYAQLWIGEVFRGESSSPPRVVRSDAEARQYVAAHAAAIALIAPAAIDATVKVLTVDGKSVGEDDYALEW